MVGGLCVWVFRFMSPRFSIDGSKVFDLWVWGFQFLGLGFSIYGFEVFES